MAYPNLVKIDTYELTDQGRAPLKEDRDERSVIVELANGTTKKYIKAIKRTWSLSWTWLPNLSSATFDLQEARNIINQIGTSSSTHTLLLRNQDGSTSTYTVWVSGYNEEIIRRDYAGNTFFYNVSLELTEQ